MGKATRKIWTVKKVSTGQHRPHIAPRGQGEMTISEARVEAERLNNALPAQHATGHGIIGIGGIGIYEENEMPQIPTVAQIERMERLERQATYCQRCGESDVFDGAMFTTLGSSGLCDDCV